MAGSEAEREIRDAVVAWFREEYPQGRIIHELNCGHGKNRLDVACVTPTQIIAAEIKSKKDVLKRLAAQVETFNECCHIVIAIVDEKFFEHFTYDNGNPGFRCTEKLREASRNAELWCYPRPTEKLKSTYKWQISPWKLKDYQTPDTRALLNLLWAEELREAARQHNIAVTNRTPAYQLCKTLWRKLTGEQIVRAVCAGLRARDFAEADEPIPLTETPETAVA